MLSSPWYLVVATAGTLVLLVWAALVGFVAGFAYLLFRAPLVPGLLLMGAVVALAVWWGPGCAPGPGADPRSGPRRDRARRGPVGWPWPPCWRSRAARLGLRTDGVLWDSAAVRRGGPARCSVTMLRWF